MFGFYDLFLHSMGVFDVIGCNRPGQLQAGKSGRKRCMVESGERFQGVQGAGSRDFDPGPWDLVYGPSVYCQLRQ